MPRRGARRCRGRPGEALLHLYNCCGEAGASLLVVAREAPARWPIALPDLASRLRAAPSVAIALPDDALLGAVLVKHFADRQVRVAPGVIAFLVRRMERSFAAAGALAARLDRLALSAGRPISIALARWRWLKLFFFAKKKTAIRTGTRRAISPSRSRSGGWRDRPRLAQAGLIAAARAVAGNLPVASAR